MKTLIVNFVIFFTVSSLAEAQSFELSEVDQCLIVGISANNNKPIVTGESIRSAMLDSNRINWALQLLQRDCGLARQRPAVELIDLFEDRGLFCNQQGYYWGPQAYLDEKFKKYSFENSRDFIRFAECLRPTGLFD